MGRPPCCDKVGVKKGPWTPEEDIMLVSYVQEHGPGNWRAVPTITGLRRCSKSCRLRWTNYLRPGIKRGSFADHEEKMIIQLQALLGNKWAAIASYLPERTDNDIKNYWNTHLKKKLKKIQTGLGDKPGTTDIGYSSSPSHSISRGQWERRLQADIHTAKQALHDALSFESPTPNQLSDHQTLTTTSSNGCTSHVGPGKASSLYASSTENIARLLKGWVKNTPKPLESPKCTSSNDQHSSNNAVTVDSDDQAFESLFGLDSFESSNSDDLSRSTSPGELVDGSSGSDPIGLAPLSALEDWLFDDQAKDYLTNFYDEIPDLF